MNDTQAAAQQRQHEWHEQWSMFQDQERFLLEDWIRPYRLEDFRGKRVLECGCGGGHHTCAFAQHAQHVTAVDLNTADLARQNTADLANVELLEADLMTMDLRREFDVCVCIGVVHHTDSPERAVANLKRHLAPGGLLILWVYSKEGNTLVRWFVEPVRRSVLRRLNRRTLSWIAGALTAALYVPVWSVYRLPLRWLPYYEYFANFRRLSFNRNMLNVFDKLNAPQTDFISRARAEAFVADLEERCVLGYCNVSYSISGRRLA